MAECRSCKFYKESQRGFCSMKKKRVRAEEYCKEYKIRLADHYMRSPWDEWKERIERENAGGKKR